MPIITDQGLIINKTPYGESDLLITFYTLERGKMTGIGKGAKRSRKRFPGRLELFSLVRFNGFAKRGAALPRIDECELLEPFQDIQYQPRAFFSGCYFLEIINRCCPDFQANRQIFTLLTELFEFLSRPAGKNFACQVRLFELQIIVLLGFAPLLDYCLGCRKRENHGKLFFDPEAGGLICQKCRHRYPLAFPVSPGTIAILNKFLQSDSSLRRKLNFTPRIMDETARLCRSLLRWHTGQQFKSLQYIDALDQTGRDAAIKPVDCLPKQFSRMS
jgi:DNA repair protein RecO (recombination protein O)